MWELQEQIEQMVDQYFEDASAIRVSAEAVGLDARAGYLFISTEEGWIASGIPELLSITEALSILTLSIE